MKKLLVLSCALIATAVLALGVPSAASAAPSIRTPPTTTTSPPSPTATVRDSGKVTWPSGAGTFSASTFGAWRNRAMDVWTTWNDAHTWNNMEQLWTLSYYETAPRFAGRMSFAQPLLDDSSSYAGCNAGDYDTHYRTIATKLASRGFANAYVRLSWEMNGDWYKWKVGTDYLGFTNCFARAARIFKSVSPSFAIEWNPAGGWTSTFSNLIYPGDDVVDVVGVDTYDGWPNASTPAEFDAKCNQNYGLAPMGPCTYATFARAHGKKLSVPEWGIRQSTNGDNPVFIQQMFAFFSRNADILAYEAYFDLQGANFEISHGANPKSAAAYLALWGGAAVTAPTTTTTVPPTTTTRPPATTTTVPPTTVPPTTTTTVPPATTTTVPPSSSTSTTVARPLAWTSGAAAADPAAFAAWRGRALGIRAVSNAAPTWALMRAMPGLTGVASGTTVVMTQPLLDQSSTFKACYTGSYDDQFRAIASALVARGLPNATVRLSPDPNATGSTYATSDSRGYARCFAEAAKTIKKQAPGVKIAWSPTASNGTTATAYYPGSSYVDVIAPTLTSGRVSGAAFDTACTAGTAKAPVGLCRYADYATAAGKPLAVMWTLAGNDAVFPTRMFAFLTARSAKLSFESYDATGAGLGLSSGAFAAAGQAYRSQWG